jgi:Dyp-type peroxidase family
MTKSLRECDIFFGNWPETIAFAAVLTPPGLGSFAQGVTTRLRSLLESFLASGTPGLSFWPAFGSAGYDPADRPKRLTRLNFNGDTPDIVDFTARIAFGVFLAGKFDDVVASARELKQRIKAVAPDMAVEIGSRFAEGRGHGGFIDGHSNLQELSPEQFDSCVFVGREDSRFENGSYAVIRKYEEDVELWTDLPDVVQEQILGRNKQNGDLLGGERFWRGNGTERVLPTAHAARARPDSGQRKFSWENRIYRRSVSYIEAAAEGTISQGLIFIALNRNPAKQTERIHNEVMLPPNGDHDLLMSAGYVSPLRTYLVYLPARCSFDI